MNRLTHLLPILLLSLLAACTPDDPFIASPLPEDTVDLNTVAFLRVVHASDDAPAASVVVGGAPMFNNAPQQYLRFTTGGNEAKYYPVDSSKNGTATTIEFRSGTTTIASGSMTLQRGGYYSAYLYGIDGDYDVLITADTLFPKPSADSARYRVVNLSPDSPALQVRQGTEEPAKAPVVIDRITYGRASGYVRSKAHPIGAGTGLYLYDADKSAEVLRIDPPFIILPGEAVFTIVTTGYTKPTGESEFIHPSLFQENRAPAINERLYGGLPIGIQLGALRLINLVANGDTVSVDLSILDNLRQEIYARNEYYRKDLTRSHPVVWQKYHAELQKTTDTVTPYFMLSLLLRNQYPYQIEIHKFQSDYGERLYAYQTRMVDGPRNDLVMAPNQRYSVYVYGPFDTTKAKSVAVHDNVPSPTPGFTRVRLFHGSFKDSTRSVSVRVAGATGKQMTYGEAPDGVTGSFEVTPGVHDVEVLDQAGNVIHTQRDIRFDANTSYMLAFSNGWTGDVRMITAVSENVIIR